MDQADRAAAGPGETGPEMHARALDLALAEVDTPYFMVIHTDTIVINDLWLDFLINRIIASPKIAGIGSWKLELVSRWKRAGKAFETFFRRLFGRKSRKEVLYLRSHCAMYRTDLVREVGLGFFDGDTAGKSPAPRPGEGRVRHALHRVAGAHEIRPAPESRDHDPESVPERSQDFEAGGASAD